MNRLLKLHDGTNGIVDFAIDMYKGGTEDAYALRMALEAVLRLIVEGDWGYSSLEDYMIKNE